MAYEAGWRTVRDPTRAASPAVAAHLGHSLKSALQYSFRHLLAFPVGGDQEGELNFKWAPPNPSPPPPGRARAQERAPYILSQIRPWPLPLNPRLMQTLCGSSHHNNCDDCDIEAARQLLLSGDCAYICSETQVSQDNYGSEKHARLHRKTIKAVTGDLKWCGWGTERRRRWRGWPWAVGCPASCASTCRATWRCPSPRHQPLSR